MRRAELKKLVIVGLLLVGAACSIGPKMVYHSFEFGNVDGENRDIEVLDYNYGGSQTPETHPEAYQLKTGHITQAAAVGGVMKVGDFLYVKWRVNSTGKVYEDRVDLKSRLPADMDEKTIHFSIQGSQLYVYLATEELHAAGAEDCPVRLYRHFQCTRIYPGHWTNF